MSKARELTEATPEGRRFAKRIDSFSFDADLDAHEDTTAGEDEEDNRIESGKVIRKEQSGGSESSKVILRSGRHYRRRVNSTPRRLNSVGKLFKNPSLTLVDKRPILKRSLSCEDIPHSENMSLDYSKVNQLITSNIPVFSGETDSNLYNELEVFVKCCEKVYECLVGSQEVELFLRLISTKLRGRAFSVLSGESYKTFDELKRLVYEKFTENKSYRLLVDELRLTRQIPGETVCSFGERLNLGYQKCKRKAHTTYQECEALLADLEELAINTFLVGLADPNLRLYFLRDNERSLRNILEKARKIEARERELYIQNFHPFLGNFSQHSQTTNPSPSEINTSFHSVNNVSNFQPSLNSTFLNGNGNVPPNTVNSGINYTTMPTGLNSIFNTNCDNSLAGLTGNGNGDRNQVKQELRSPRSRCSFCNRAGHNSPQCRARKSSPFCGKCQVYGHSPQSCTAFRNPNALPERSINNFNTRKKCEFCKRTGHDEQECRARQDWESKHSSNRNTSSENWTRATGGTTANALKHK